MANTSRMTVSWSDVKNLISLRADIGISCLGNQFQESAFLPFRQTARF
jgi:hypothetical protein